MENIFLVKIQTNVNQRKHVHNSFLSEVSHTIKIQNFWPSKLKWFLFCIRTYFSLLGWTGSYICHISACRFLNHKALICGFLLYWIKRLWFLGPNLCFKYLHILYAKFAFKTCDSSSWIAEFVWISKNLCWYARLNVFCFHETESQANLNVG